MCPMIDKNNFQIIDIIILLGLLSMQWGFKIQSFKFPDKKFGFWMQKTFEFQLSNGIQNLNKKSRFSDSKTSNMIIISHCKSELYEGRISNGPIFKWLGFSYGYESQPFQNEIIQNLDIFIQISHGWAFRYQIPFKIQTICNPTSF